MLTRNCVNGNAETLSQVRVESADNTERADFNAAVRPILQNIPGKIALEK